MSWFDFSVFYLVFGFVLLVALVAGAAWMIGSGRNRRED